MPDFTSVLYLGMNHPHEALRPWRHLTTGRPDGLEPSARAERLAGRFARFSGHAAAALAGSTLHIFWDLFDCLARDGIVIHVDEGAYPVARWGIDRAAARGVRVASFPKHDSGALLANLATAGGRLRPVVVADAICPLTGRPAPLDEYVEICRAFGGRLVVDDTQGIGLFGRNPLPASPYGEDGAGTAAWFGIQYGGLLVVSSLAKAFGAPLAALAGSMKLVNQFKATSLTRIHCSPPSLAAVSAAEAALSINDTDGLGRRQRLLGLIGAFRAGLARLGLTSQGGIFPFQTLTRPAGEDAITLYARLLDEGVRTVLHAGASGGRALITFVINCRHAPHEIAFALRALSRCLAREARP
jgi:8-amino-7-oxononanoate synthase